MTASGFCATAWSPGWIQHCKQWQEKPWDGFWDASFYMTWLDIWCLDRQCKYTHIWNANFTLARASLRHSGVQYREEGWCFAGLQWTSASSRLIFPHHPVLALFSYWPHLTGHVPMETFSMLSTSVLMNFEPGDWKISGEKTQCTSLMSCSVNIVPLSVFFCLSAWRLFVSALYRLTHTHYHVSLRKETPVHIGESTYCNYTKHF